jgi:hypothetical protein
MLLKFRIRNLSDQQIVKALMEKTGLDEKSFAAACFSHGLKIVVEKIVDNQKKGVNVEEQSIDDGQENNGTPSGQLPIG